MTSTASLERYVGRLTDDEALELHRFASRRAARIYAVVYADRQRAGYEASRSIRAWRDKQ